MKVTIVVYYGKEAWDGVKSLYEILDISEDMKPFVNDYKINFVEIRENNLKLHDEDNSQLFEYISIIFNKDYTTKEKRIKLLESDKAKHINKEVLMALAAATDTFDREYYKRIIENSEKEGVSSMNEVFNELLEEGRKEGQARQIVRLSIKYNAPKESIITELNISAKQAKEYYDIYSS